MNFPVLYLEVILKEEEEECWICVVFLIFLCGVEGRQREKTWCFLVHSADNSSVVGKVFIS